MIYVRKYFFSPIRNCDHLSIDIGYGSTSTLIYLRYTLLSWHYYRNRNIVPLYLGFSTQPHFSIASSSFSVRTSCNSPIIQFYQVYSFLGVFYSRRPFLYLYIDMFPAFLPLLLFNHISYSLTFVFYLPTIITFSLPRNYNNMYMDRVLSCLY